MMGVASLHVRQKVSRVGVRPMAARATADEGWKHGGWLRGQGIPAPSGPHAVGCVDVMHLFEGETLGLLARLFYPTDRDSAARYPYADFCPHENYLKGYFSLRDWKLPISGFLGHLVFTSLGSPKVPALYGAPFLNHSSDHQGPKFERESELKQKGLHPVVLFSHGLGGMRTTYNGICSDLASHGYVVASVEHRDNSACASLRRVPVLGTHGKQYEDAWLEYYHLSPGEKEFPVRHRQITQRVRDVRQCLDLLKLLNDGTEIHDMMESGFDFKQFRGKLCLEKAALMGHSYGGATTIMSLMEDQRFKCGIALDCWMFPIHRDLYSRGVSQPLLFINSYEFQWEENVRSMMKLAKPPDENGHSTCQILTIRGSNHFYQTDILFLLPFFLMRTNMLSQTDLTTAHQLNQDVCNLFMRRYLLKDPALQGRAPNLDGGPGHSTDLIFGTNVAIGKSTNEKGSTPSAKL